MHLSLELPEPQVIQQAAPQAAKVMTVCALGFEVYMHLSLELPEPQVVQEAALQHCGGHAGLVCAI